MKKYVVRFAQVRLPFRVPELLSICQFYGIPVEFDPESYREESPFIIVGLPSDEDVLKILERTVLVQDIAELIDHASTLSELHEKVQSEHLEFFEPLRDSSFKFVVKAYLRTISEEEQRDVIESFGYLPLMGVVSLKNPQIVFAVFFDKDHAYFGRWVGFGNRNLPDRFDLSKRCYLGTTSMNPELSVIMANMAHADKGKLVYDPFVGTGSLVCVASAAFGAYSFGSDIDGRQMRGTTRGKDGSRNLFSVAKQYNASGLVLDALVFDFTRNPWRSKAAIFDAIISDPPYGVRAGAKRIGVKDTQDPSEIIIPEDRRDCTVPKMKPYAFDELALDLARFAINHLSDRGRLVFWYPIETGLGTDKEKAETVKNTGFDPKRLEISQNGRSLRLVACSPEYLQSLVRFLVTMECITES